MRSIRGKLFHVAAVLLLLTIGGNGYAIEGDSIAAAGSSTNDIADELDIEASCLRSNGPFAWYCAGPIAGMTCVQILEPSDPDTWYDNYFCSSWDMGIRWSFAGTIPWMRCTRIIEPSEPAEHTWGDNYLCVPDASRYYFFWNFAGPLDGLDCVQWYEGSDPHTWSDNWLCWLYV